MCTYICVNLPQAGCTLNLREGGHQDIYDYKFMTIPSRLCKLEFTQNYPGDFMVNLELQTILPKPALAGSSWKADIETFESEHRKNPGCQMEAMG